MKSQSLLSDGMMISDKVVSVVVMVLLVVGYVWYTCWMVLTPMVDESHIIHHYFPDRYWGLALPISFGVVMFSIALGLYTKL